MKNSNIINFFIDKKKSELKSLNPNSNYIKKYEIASDLFDSLIH